ncbi:homeodomain-interacting protein kinase 3-like [Pleuronectes platessa]|uniref:homeodomain-interacting protein kinase 3-like n=1 Tax=Pleuronectes platessa TaxID=8262 RepID=UPI00232A38EF|nr:homeodomain-interacting protein kinase 3-like [Pleuronectes platessa]
MQRYLGKGNVGYVSECRREDTNATVALKISSGPRQIRGAKYEEINLRKLKELNADQFNIVKWIGSFTFEEFYCLEFEKLDINLSQFIERTRAESLNLKQIRPILHQLATSLNFLKSEGITHADIKPQNIVMVDQVNEPLRVKVIDFGLALDDPAKYLGATIQCLSYRCPEILLGAPFNEAVDVWSLGCTAAEMFRGKKLFNPWNPSDLMHETSGKDGDAGESDLANFINLLTQMLKVDPSERITPRGILEHPFLTMSHLQGEFKNSSYVESSKEMMNVCQERSSPSGEDAAKTTPETSLNEGTSTRAINPPQKHCPAGVSAEEPSASQASTDTKAKKMKRNESGDSPDVKSCMDKMNVGQEQSSPSGEDSAKRATNPAKRHRTV